MKVTFRKVVEQIYVEDLAFTQQDESSVLAVLEVAQVAIQEGRDWADVYELLREVVSTRDQALRLYDLLVTYDAYCTVTA